MNPAEVIRVVSDLHFEFHRDRGRTLVEELGEGNFDVLVVAGDLSNHRGLAEALRLVCEGLHPKPVVYVLGNHEYYGATRSEVRETVSTVAKQAGNLVFLDDTVAEVCGRRFVGSTLWFAHSGQRQPEDQFLSDFSEIRGLRQWLPSAGVAARDFLAGAVRSGDVVVTHHLPHPSSIAPRYANSVLNGYFLHDVSHTVESGGAALWVHGHTHTSCDYRAGTTRVVCNPFGYVGIPGEPNPTFRADCDHRPWS